MNLTLAVVAINGWNRFLIGSRVPPVLAKAPGSTARAKCRNPSVAEKPIEPRAAQGG